MQMEERPPIWRVAANTLNKQSQTADKGWSSRLGVEVLQHLTVKTGLVMKRIHVPQAWANP